MASGGKYLGHYHLETKEKNSKDIIGDTLKFADDLKQIISLEKIDMVKRNELLHDMML